MAKAKIDLEKCFRKLLCPDESHYKEVWAPRLRVTSANGFGVQPFALSWSPVTNPVTLSTQHAHEFDELFFFAGGDGTNLPELGGVVEFPMGLDPKNMEVFTITEATCVYIPAGVYHCPIYFKKIYDPQKPIVYQMLYFKTDDNYGKVHKDPAVMKKIKERQAAREKEIQKKLQTKDKAEIKKQLGRY
jgi:mannose-6-phosphate isomerase-like protein (cupin superfamily)